ncbi:uncharacterized protein LOC127813016 [Diospyros lotus]|uniref:uncharacterized protein LOC127813016 n=1 Tax=Diospyros lotus TaxID=55363 RepID=UPI0022532F55|nr:uncharacterized protein LOC127813016 [Diospyros lotus]XP_052209635.1 uncharacterized protein LOC127813016 [Diospyros lotus]XP_052209637.1 uncharacterized protein LOC127813016 [Diospyros lotus]XP_052209638.1 uncharacterized protein LOC127813016 [Diospyros lotus]XP_052209639.1 uncharacterized protein LOC127813016 [Diospyros lotus]
MSNNIVSQPFPVPGKQMDPIPNKLEVPIPNMRLDMIGGMYDSAMQQFDISNKQMGLVEPISGNVPALNGPRGHMEQPVSSFGMQQFVMPNQQVGDMGAMSNNLGVQYISLPSKRTAMGEPMFSSPRGQRSLMPNKSVAQMEPMTGSLGFHQLISANRRSVQVISQSGNLGSEYTPVPNKKMARNESIPGRSGNKKLQTPKSRTTQMEPSPKGRTESFESVRSKMRESLASAFALVTQKQEKASNGEGKAENEVAMPLHQTRQECLVAESASAPANAIDHVSEDPSENLSSKESCPADKDNDGQSTLQVHFTDGRMENSAHSWNVGQEEHNTILPNEDVAFSDSFFVKDDLLQGNGLAWAFDVDVGLGETNETQIAKKPRLVNEMAGGEAIEEVVKSPQSLAFKIEAELFKLFGGVNKKYKEKGRSLLFNLKDRNNPELRERVMSGEISPERLCSMTAEELASKELSEWRMAKAEEMAQMVVLPDSDVDIRRLVKKTHKGEFQVEVEQDDGVSVEVSVGSSSLDRVQSKSKGRKAHPSAKADEIKDRRDVAEKSGSENQDPSCSLTIPNDGTDLMQGLMVDEFKDAEFLPPIVSLDEFMESLDSEPPFENLPEDGGKKSTASGKGSSRVGREDKASNLASKEPEDTVPQQSDKMDGKNTESELKLKSRGSPVVEPKPSPPTAASKGDMVWEGVLQLNVSAMVTVTGFYKSGEKTSTKEWPISLEIKGRVRLDAFEKFIQELHMSRSRAVMVVHFALKEEGSSDGDHANLTEAVHSYVLDERLGYAEPAPAVELYFCPPHQKTLEMLSKHLPKDHTDLLNSIDNGLIGIVVFRRAHLSSAFSPTSHHKHGSKRHQPFASRRHQDKYLTMNADYTSSPTPPAKSQPPVEDDDNDDDIPPGFGPAAARDEDDLPEFTFTGPSNPHPSRGRPGVGPLNRASLAPRPVEKIRELIHKYGQPGNNPVPTPGNVGAGLRTWDDDDDDDIPEWQPQPQPQPHIALQPPRPPVHDFRQSLPHYANQLPGVAMPVQTPVNMVQSRGPGWQQQGGRWVQPPGPHPLQHGNLVGQTGGRQFVGASPVLPAGQSGMEWRRSRGF